MMWAGICGDKPIGPDKVDDGVKLTSQTYAASHAANATRQFLKRKGISGRS
jgi:hypothetical protein